VESNPQVVDVALAGEAMDLPARTILHAGPPVAWERLCGPQARAIMGAIQFEGWAANNDEAAALVASGEVTLRPNHMYNAVGPMTGVISPSMPVLVIRNEPFGNYAFSSFNEGRGNTLWFGVFDRGTLDRLRWIRDRAGPAMKAAIKQHGPLGVFDIIAQGLQMGDECHARHAACTALLVKRLMSHMLEAGVEGKTVAEIIRFVDYYERHTGAVPDELVFDSKLTTYARLAKLDARDIHFITLRRRTRKMLGDIYSRPASAWQRITLPALTRLFRTPKVLDERVNAGSVMRCQAEAGRL